jgi:hypothetical protein
MGWVGEVSEANDSMPAGADGEESRRQEAEIASAT